MKPRLLPLGAALLMSFIAGPIQAQPRQAAELMPANAFAYVELYQPRQIVREMRALAKGSRLQDVAAAVADCRARQSDALNYLEAILSPELVDDFALWHGAGMAFTGVDSEGEPEGVAVLLTGKSHMPGIIARFLLATSELQPAGKVEGVPLYRGALETNVNIFHFQPPSSSKCSFGMRIITTSSLVCLEGGKRESKEGAEEHKQPEATGPTVAVMPGALIVGSSPELVGDVIRRAKGKPAGATLANKPVFQEATHLRKPGLFAYVDFAALFAQVDKQVPEKEEKWARLKKLVNAEALRYGAAAWWLSRNEMRLEAEVKLVPGQTSPLLEMLPQQAASTKVFQFLPRAAFMTWALAVPRAEKLPETIEALAEWYQDEDQASSLPQACLHKLGSMWRMHLLRELLSKTASIGVGTPMDKKGENAAPAWVIEAVDVEAARALEALLPRLFSADPLKPLALTTSKVGSHVIHTVPDEAVRPEWSRHLVATDGLAYGRSGKVLVICSEPEQVAAVLNNGCRRSGFVSEPKNALALQKTGNACAIGTFSFDPIIQMVMKTNDRQRQNPEAAPEDKDPWLGNCLRELAPILKTVPPCVASLRRTEDGVNFVVSQTGLRKASATTIDLLLEMAFHTEGWGFTQRRFAVVPPAPLDTLPGSSLVMPPMIPQVAYLEGTAMTGVAGAAVGGVLLKVIPLPPPLFPGPVGVPVPFPVVPAPGLPFLPPSPSPTQSY